MNFKEIKSRYFDQVEKAIQNEMKLAEERGIAACAKMSAYHLETGGKRLRALIPLMVFEALGKAPDQAIPLGVAVELIHNATLVHDDLQDGDEFRRDRPTVWKKYSPAQAINCGDALFYFGIQSILRLKVDSSAFAKIIDRATMATLAVIEGQAQEFLMKEEPFPGIHRYETVIRGKTSGLFALPVVSAMEACGQASAACIAVERASMDLGMLFQIQDDLLDIYGKKGRGDQIATDIAEGKVSMLVAHVYDAGSPADRIRLQTILRKPRAETTNTEIAEAIAIFERSGAKPAAIKKMRDIQKDLRESMDLQAVPAIRQMLIDLSDQFLEPVHEIL